MTTDYENFDSGFCLENVQLISYLHWGEISRTPLKIHWA